MNYKDRVKEVFKNPFVANGLSELEPIQKQYLKQAQSINPPIAKKILLEVENEVILSYLEAGTLSAESQNKIGQSLSKLERRTLENKFLDLGFTKKEISSFLN